MAILVVPLDYSVRPNRKELTPASVRVIAEVAKYVGAAEANDIIIAYGNMHQPKNGFDGPKSIVLKEEKLASLVSTIRRFPVCITNSIDEAQNIRDALAAKRFHPMTIVLFCDRWHARRLRMIWKHFFPESRVEIRRFDCGPFKTVDYSQVFLHSGFRWASINLLGLLLMKVFGIERMRGVTQPN